MNKISTVVIGIIAVIALGFGIVAVNHPTQVVTQPVGGTNSPDFFFSRLTFNGVPEDFYRQVLHTATTTPCAVLSPAATSSLMFDTLQINTATSTATVWTTATSTTAYATTTPIVPNFSLASGALNSFAAATTTNSGNSAGTIIAPYTWIVWGVAGVTPADTTKLEGECQVGFREL